MEHLTPTQFAALHGLEVSPEGYVWLYKAMQSVQAEGCLSKGGLFYAFHAETVDPQWEPTYTYCNGLFFTPTFQSAVAWAKREGMAINLTVCQVVLDEILVLDEHCVKAPRALGVCLWP